MTVSAQERHTRSKPCPICGGFDGMKRGKGIRCNGYTSIDGKWAFCSQVAEGMHHEAQSAAGPLYVHLLRDEPLNGHRKLDAAVPARTVADVSRELGIVENASETALTADEYEAHRDDYDRLWAELEAMTTANKRGPAKVTIEFAGSAVEPVAPLIRWVEPASLTAKLPDINWICQGLRLAPGAVSCFSGYGYSGKTAVGQSLLISVANGLDFLRVHRCEQGLAGHLDYEQGFRLSVERMQRLCRGFGLALEEGLKNIRYCPFPEVYLDEKRAYDAICRAIDGLRIVLIDSSRAAMPGVEENDSKSRVHVDTLSRISEKTGTAFLLICHDGKSGETPRQQKERTRGSSAMYDAMQVMWGFERKDSEDFGRAVLRKDRLSGSKAEFGYRFEDVRQLDSLEGSLLVHHLEPEQMRGEPRTVLIKAHLLETLKKNPGLMSVEDIRFHMPDGYKHMTDVRAGVRELERSKVVSFDRDRGYVPQ